MVGETTLEQVTKIFGPATPRRASKADEADTVICYVFKKSGHRSFLKFESSVMGGAERRVTGIQISTEEPPSFCSGTKVDLSALRTHQGVFLGQKIASFLATTPLDFRREGSTYVYAAESKRPATPEELAKLRAMWPNEKQDYFDVATTIRAKFSNGRLANYYAHRIESY
jgi:hypothetical protein